MIIIADLSTLISQLVSINNLETDIPYECQPHLTDMEHEAKQELALIIKECLTHRNRGTKVEVENPLLEEVREMVRSEIKEFFLKNRIIAPPTLSAVELFGQNIIKLTEDL